MDGGRAVRRTASSPNQHRLKVPSTRAVRTMELLNERVLRRRVVKIALAGWFTAMVGLSAILLARHVVPLPRPSGDDAALATALAALRRPEDAQRFFAVHVLFAECRCSQRISEHLLTSTRPPDLGEAVLLVGESPELEARLGARGFAVTRVDADELGTRYHVKAAPILVLLAPDGAVRYAGGYTTSKQGPDPRDLDIIARARTEGGLLKALPVFGCAVAEKLRQRLDPTGLL